MVLVSVAIEFRRKSKIAGTARPLKKQQQSSKTGSVDFGLAFGLFFNATWFVFAYFYSRFSIYFDL